MTSPENPKPKAQQLPDTAGMFEVDFAPLKFKTDMQSLWVAATLTFGSGALVAAISTAPALIDKLEGKSGAPTTSIVDSQLAKPPTPEKK